ncbi:ferric reductase-like transmembrane domain-containing protein [Rhodoferax sp.]|uniref:ferredoxin reductase family protein n=1 Tax=Rhodoferax sp. TaxID=50421 RepID=UPI00272F8C00|nr:ferric reductase-like transmembrane domain-containing protein [Rhodoferax sp.]MDP1531364.1 ferric reductase-like transmembrane domain-containing protein [Rhodoferax sp.]MDP1944827.1 ferric reductase-like transmembrane domain-containing protein [Rhodoferax sp.]MDP2443721.1 ferric reductase-like transmembrane domain-containing protein [Rhodoferax sp.]MDZ4208427.1 ferric reductase-like transmembrane domain-containing protein [Rhodoferax sp.]
MKTLFASLITLLALSWGWDIAQAPVDPQVHALWLARQQLLHLSGLLSVAMMSLAMLLATRPVWLEAPLGGMDRIYRSHKWAGILAVGFAALHWLVEMSDDILKALIGRQGRVPEDVLTGLLDVLRDLAEDMGEWAIYALLAMLVITLWKKFPYRPWRFLHRAMPVLYLMLAFHAVLLAPTDYWTQPVGALLAVLLAAGVFGAVHTLLGRIGKARETAGEIIAVAQLAPDVTTVVCRLGPGWRGHRPGQFAFVSFDDQEGAHPFTMASADQGDHTISFQIKALGDYTRSLPQRLRPGQSVRVEGPYGRFDMGRRQRRARQIWIAGGIGVTPFLAWLESLQATPDKAPAAELHYCTRDQSTDAFAPRLLTLCATLPSVQLHIHDARQGAKLTASALGVLKNTEIWFCGPTGLAEALRQGMAALGWRPRFHQEAFEMR